MAPDGWQEWSKYVLAELKELSRLYDCLDKKVGNMRVDIATLKVKAGIWGLIGGMIPVALIVVLWLLKK